MNKTCDVLIVGAGIAGVYTALNLNEDLNIILITKETLRECNSYLAQGGISTALDTDDIPYFIEDTLKAGNYKNNENSVSILANESIDNINRLINFGVHFDKNEDNSLLYTREGGHSNFRIVHIKDETGKYVMETLYNELSKRKNIEVLESCKLIDLIKNKDKCLGGLCTYYNKEIQIHSKRTILATGGVGGLFTSTTNFPSLTGDGISIALKNDVALKDMNYLQLHPTVLYEENSKGKRLLLSESLRGEGALIRNLEGYEFVNPLKPRDIVATEILNQIQKTPTSPYVYLDLRHLDKDFLINHFPFLYKECFKRGYSMDKDLLPISPAHHYAMGGIEIDSYGQSSLINLFSLGETACTGVHGNNRLASNSLLEAIVFGYRCATKINTELCTEINMEKPQKEDLIEFLKKRVDDNYVKLFNNR